MKDPNVLIEGRLTWGEILLGVIVAWVMCAIGGLGCGGEPIAPEAPGSAPAALCAERDATYWVTYLQAPGGTCGDISEHAVAISGRPQRPAQCGFGKVIYSPDNCEVENIGIVCPMETQDPQAPGATYTFNGKVRWLPGAEGAFGKLTAVARNASGGVLCASDYDVVYQITKP